MIDLGFDREQLARDQDRIARQMLGAGAGAIRASTKTLERKLEAKTKQALEGNLWRAWKSNAFPRQGIAKEPVGTVFLNGGERTRGAFEFFTKPGRIRGRGGGLAIPTKAAGPRGRTRLITPAEWERANGVELRYVPGRRGRPSKLVADGKVGANGRFRPITRARNAADERRGFQRGQTTVVIFVIVPFVSFRNNLNILPTIQDANRDVAREFERRASSAS